MQSSDQSVDELADASASCFMSAESTPENRDVAVKTRLFRWAGTGIVLIAAILRLYDLDLKPLHHDEGVNGFFVERLVRDGFYQYDPANYHGPTLYYFALSASHVFGLTTFSIRLLPALSGIGVVCLALCLRRRIGAAGALATASLLALSPGAIYFSRYFIHESLFVFLGFSVVVFGLKYYDSGGAAAAVIAAFAAALLFATKETATITIGVVAMAVTCSLLVARDNRSRSGRMVTPLARAGIPAAGVFIGVLFLFYSSFFTNPRGLLNIVRAFSFWVQTGRSEHVHKWYTYSWWLIKHEPVLVGLGLMGVGLALGLRRSRFAVFTALWAIGLTTAYSLIPYKTPWLCLNFIVPLAIMAGYAMQLLFRRAKVGAIAVVIIGLGVSLIQAVHLNYFRYDDDSYPYVYAHTQRDVLRLIDQIDQIASNTGKGTTVPISITSPDYWPLPWYLRGYLHTAYHGQVVVTSDTMIIGSESQEAELRVRLGDAYNRIGLYGLRPGVNLVLYVRRDEGR